MVFVDNSSIGMQENIKLRELFVQDHNGTTMAEVFLFTSHLPLLTFINIFLEIYVINRFPATVSTSVITSLISKVEIFLLEFVVIVCPTILIFTILSDYLIFTFLAVTIITFIITIFSVTSPDMFVLYWKLPNSKTDYLKDTVFLTKQPFITYFRSLVFIATTTSILGVDFHIYPRRFAKTETYGVSIMDLGVGLFVMSNALVKKNSVKTQSQGLYKTSLESVVFAVLGVIRYYMVQRFNYQQHLSEYGVHWNFFFTLALVKFLSFLIMKISNGYNLFCGVILLILHQYFLTSSLENYVLSEVERDGWFSANREGIVSTCGYLSLYLIGVSISNMINTVDAKSTKGKLRIFVCLLSFGVCLSLFTYYVNMSFYKISRRLANLSYVTWVTGISVVLLALTLLVELLCICFFPIKPNLKSKLYSIITPALLESINFNGLLFFLLSNLLTGLVNICIDVLNLDSYGSLIILTSYMAVNCAVVYGFYLINIKLKVW